MRLESGRVITLNKLRQQLTYAGLIEGTPYKEMNDDFVARIVGEELGRALGQAIHLIEPVETPIPRPDTDFKFARIPRVACIGDFESDPVKSRWCASALTIIWFQNDFAWPVSADLADQIAKTPWDALAYDFDI